MIDNLLGNGDDDDESTDSDDAEGLFDEGGGGDLDADADLMGDDDELMDTDDVSMGGMDDGGGGGAGGSTEEVQHRMDELENEVDSLSSDISTVKNENEQISDAIDDVEDNIRKLLEIYEMVTKGVNPFVDETEIGEAFSSAGSSGDSTMGLFDETDETDASGDDGIDESVANADAEEFFDEDLADEADEEFDTDDFEDADPETDDLDETGQFDGELAESKQEDEAGDAAETDDENDGKSFEDLKARYESDDEDSADADADSADADAVEDGSSDSRDEPTDRTADSVEGGKPYLDTIPPGYVADVVVMDWLEFLVDEAGVDGAARTIAYYEAIEWLSERAAERLQTYLLGFGDGVTDDPEPRSSLTVSHHNTSLRFISRVADPSMEMVAFDDRLDGRRDSGFAGRVADPSSRRDPAGPSTARSSRPSVESDGGRDHPNERGVRPSDVEAASRGYGRERYPNAAAENDPDRDETDDQAADEDQP